VRQKIYLTAAGTELLQQSRAIIQQIRGSRDCFLICKGAALIARLFPFDHSN